jgi:hypothetical protein
VPRSGETRIGAASSRWKKTSSCFWSKVIVKWLEDAAADRGEVVRQLAEGCGTSKEPMCSTLARRPILEGLSPESVASSGPSTGPKTKFGERPAGFTSKAAPLPESIRTAKLGAAEADLDEGDLVLVVQRMASPGRPSSGILARSTIRSFG